jgi:diguanylate cyclase (GGDEF)-like protein/PAS domain S-box-containing protein
MKPDEPDDGPRCAAPPPGGRPAEAVPEAVFDRLARLARRVLGAPVALVSLVGAERQIFAGAAGLPEPFASARGTPLSHSFCRHVVEEGSPLVVGDARHHPLVRDNPAIRDLGVVAYLGVPVHAGDGVPIGALCVIEPAPRAWRSDDLLVLNDLAELAATEFALRREMAGREAALREVRQSESRYRAIVEDQTELVCRYLPDTTLTFVNGAYARHFGRRAADLVGARFVELVPPEARAAVLAHVAALRPGEPVTHEHEALLPDGATGWQQWTNRAIADGHGAVVECQAVGRDITARKRLELELAAAKARLDDALASMGDGFVLYDAGERLVLCNEPHRRLFPASADLRVPGAEVRDIWREEARRGVYKGVDAGNVEAWMAERRAAAVAGSGGYELELADGRWIHFRPGPTAEGGTIVVARDVTERKDREREALRQAFHDPLTDLPNRRLFRRELARAHARVGREGGRLGVVLADLDGFKAVNDRHGHDAGDALLVEVARRLQGCVRAGDLVARLGGDEFGILLTNATGDDPGGFAALAGRLAAALDDPVDLGDLARVRVGVSLGVTVFPDDPGGPDELTRHADRALYAAKAAGRGTWRAWGDAALPPLNPAAPAPAAPSPG